jgi:hypothetical protein
VSVGRLDIAAVHELRRGDVSQLAHRGDVEPASHIVQVEACDAATGRSRSRPSRSVR